MFLNDTSHSDSFWCEQEKTELLKKKGEDSKSY